MDRIGLPGQGLGDILLMTSVCKYIPDLTVEIKTYAARMSCLFDGICKETIITDNPINSMPPPIGMTYIEALMGKFDLKDKKPLPYIKLTDHEKQEGLDFASQYKNPIIIITNSTLPFLRDMEHK